MEALTRIAKEHARSVTGEYEPEDGTIAACVEFYPAPTFAEVADVAAALADARIEIEFISWHDATGRRMQVAPPAPTPGR